MKILVLYYSKGGNTRKLAESVAQGVDSVDEAEAVVRSTAEVTKDDFESCVGLAAGSPVYFGTMAADLKRVFDEFISLRKRMEGKVGAVFATGGANGGGQETTMFSIIQAMLIYGMIIIGDPMAATGHYGTTCLGAPDEAAKENGRKLGRRLAEVCLKLHA